MQFLYDPINLEAQVGSEMAHFVQVGLSQVPPGTPASAFNIWAARTAEALDPSTLIALATGALDLADIRASNHAMLRQSDGWSGLRQAGALQFQQLEGTGNVALTGTLFEPTMDKDLRSSGSPSWDTVNGQVTLERGDGPWLLAVTATLPGGSILIAMGGLGQWAGQEHLAGVWLSPSNDRILTEIGKWLKNAIEGFKPILDWSVAQVVPEGENMDEYRLKEVMYTDEVKPDVWPVIYINPTTARENSDGISAPDRREQAPVFNIRIVSYADDPVVNQQVLQQLGGAIMEMLNTRKYREAVMPSGTMINRSFVSDQNFGHTEVDWDLSVDLMWSTQFVRVGLF